MSGIDKLIARLCPRGVPFKTLGETGAFIRGNGLQKKDFADSGVGCIHYGQIHTHYRTWATETITFVSPLLAKRLRHAHPGDLVIATTSEDDEAVGKAVAWLGAEDVVVSSDAYIYRHSLDSKYVAYFFQSEQFQVQKRPYITGSKVRRLSGESLAKIRIPVPPLEIQREIAKVLDRFAELGAVLESELEARRRQYQYYRDALISDGGRNASRHGNTRWLKLGEISTVVRGASPRPIDSFLTSASDGVNWIKIGDVEPGSKYITRTAERIKPEGVKLSRLVRPGGFVLSNSMSFGRPYILKIEGCIHDGWLAISDFSETYLSDFLYHLLSSSRVYREMSVKASSGTVQNLNAEIVKSLLLPVPSFEEQHGIVTILDKFDALVNDLSIGLPAELKARRQQYQYYRDRLLTFKEGA